MNFGLFFQGKKMGLTVSKPQKSNYFHFSWAYDLDVKKKLPHNEKYFLFIRKKSVLKKSSTSSKKCVQKFLGVTVRKPLTMSL